MTHKNLQEFIHLLESENELTRISEEISAELEITEVADRAVKSGKSALLFENVKNSEIPVAINLFASDKRLELAFGATPDEIAERIREMMKMKSPEGMLEKLSLLPKLAELSKFPPKKIKKAPVHEIVWRGDEIDLDKLPILKCWPLDGGKFITLPQVVTEDPKTGVRNVGMYRLQQKSKTELIMHWQMHKHARFQFDKAKAKDEKFPVAVVLGGDAVSVYSASAPLPEGIDEYLFAGFVRKKGVELVHGISTPIFYPAEAEIVIEGFVNPNEDLVTEGPFGDHTGFYTQEEKYPVLQIESICMRKNPIYPATIVGKPPMEDFWLGKATERIFLPLLQMILPEVMDYHMPSEGVFHNLVFVKIQKKYPGHARKVVSGMLGMGMMMLAKTIVVFDDSDLDIHNSHDAWWLALNNIDPKRDVFFFEGPADVLDHASPVIGYGSKMGIDATKKWKDEGFSREWPEKAEMSEEVKKRVKNLGDRIKNGE